MPAGNDGLLIWRLAIKYHCFISYTNRESELRELKPLLDHIGATFQALGVLHAPFFLDRLKLDPDLDAGDLAAKLTSAIDESLCVIALVSPSYVSSPWCIFEWGVMSGIQRKRKEDSPGIRAYIWKPLEGTDHFVRQVAAETINIDASAITAGLAQTYGMRNPFVEHKYEEEKRKLAAFAAGALAFMAEHYDEVGYSSRPPLEPDADALRRMAGDLSSGRSIEDVAASRLRFRL